MNLIAKARSELVEIMKGAYEALQNENLPAETKAVVKGSIDSSLEYARKGDFETAKNLIKNLCVYGI